MEGALEFVAAAEAVEQCMDSFGETFDREGFKACTGILVLRASVKPDGGVSSVQIVMNNLVLRPLGLNGADTKDARAQVQTAAVTCLQQCRFAAADGPSVVTVPFMFD